MKLSREEVLRIAELAKVGLTDAEIDRMSRQLSDILENFEVLKRVDTEGVPPTAQPNALCNVMKDDIVRRSLPQDDVLANAPCREDDFFRICAVLEED